MRRESTRKLWFGAALFAIAIATLEAFCIFALWLLSAVGAIEAAAPADDPLAEGQAEQIDSFLRGESRYYAISSLLGWTVKPGGAAGLMRANGQGLRAERDYAPEPPPGIVRVATFGDSFTHGAEVAFDDTWQQQLEKMLPSVEALNFGVDAYGLDQAYLRYETDGARFGADVVVAALMTENVNRHVNTFRPFYHRTTGAPFGKPRFEEAEGGLRLVPNPLADASGYRELIDDPASVVDRIGEHDHYHQVRKRRHEMRFPATLRFSRVVYEKLSGRDPLAPGYVPGRVDAGSGAFRITAGIFERFAETASRRDATAVFLLFPNRDDMIALERTGGRATEPLADRLEAAGLPYADLTDPLLTALRSDGMDAVFSPGGHYSAEGCKIVATELARLLVSERLVELPPAGGERTLGEE